MSGEPMGRHYRTAIYWFGGMAAVLASLAVWSISYIAGMSLALVAVAFLGAALGMRCPRCGLGVDSREHAGYGVGYLPSADCPKCGRSRRGVWPFQFLLKPDRP